MTLREFRKLLETIPPAADEWPVLIGGPIIQPLRDIDLHIRPGAKCVKLTGGRK